MTSEELRALRPGIPRPARTLATTRKIHDRESYTRNRR